MSACLLYNKKLHGIMPEPFRLDMHVNGISGRRNELRRRRDSRSFSRNCHKCGLTQDVSPDRGFYESLQQSIGNPEMGKGDPNGAARERERGVARRERGGNVRLMDRRIQRLSDNTIIENG